uniref:Uncharacterized protein n=1 Tax=Cannabis sativa TaxID=3483 RepID=A0A803QRJ7_CANSA
VCTVSRIGNRQLRQCLAKSNQRNNELEREATVAKATQETMHRIDLILEQEGHEVDLRVQEPGGKKKIKEIPKISRRNNLG